MIELTEYLTEKSLGDILRAWAGPENVIPQPMVPGTRMRYDYEVVRGNKRLFVEYDGDSHFRDANVIFRDDSKDMISESIGKQVVRIPYFIQLDRTTFKTFFGEEFDVSTTFPHGFVTTKMLPASFCNIGAIRANRVLDKMPVEVRTAVMDSLAEKAKKIPYFFVYNRLSYGEDSNGKPYSYEEFIEKSVEVHGDKYSYELTRQL